jgi:hypothetical protein
MGAEQDTFASATRQGGAGPGVPRPRMDYLDIAKGFAAMSVVLLHLFNDKTLFNCLAPWHIWQAVPVFLMVAGVTGAMSCRKYAGISGNLGWEKNKADLAAYYRTLPAKALVLYIPYAVVTILYHMWSRETLGIELFFNTMFMGYLGPGGYFVPLIVQHLIFFPLVLSLRGKVGSDLKFLGAALGISIVMELLFAFADVESTRFIYRIFYFRYLFACCLGAVLADHNPFGKNTFRLLTLLSIAYIWATCYLSNVEASPQRFWNFFVIRADDWYFQHYPGFFFTAWLVFGLRDHEARIPCVELLKKLGRSSYEIFIFQMLFFITIGIWLKKTFGWAELPLFIKVISFFFCLYGGFAITRAKQIWRG